MGFSVQAMTQTADKVSEKAVPVTEKVTSKIEEKAAQVRNNHALKVHCHQICNRQPNTHLTCLHMLFPRHTLSYAKVSRTEIVYTVIPNKKSSRISRSISSDCPGGACCRRHSGTLQLSQVTINWGFALVQAAEKIGEGGDKAAMSAVDVAKQIADQAEPMAERINTKIEKEAHKLSANAEFHASDVADEYQKGVKVTLIYSPVTFLATF